MVNPVTAERYVSVDAVSGDGDGSFENPWSLSDSLNQTLPSGEPIFVNGSSSTAYTGQFTINNETILIGYNGTPIITSAAGTAFTVNNSTIMENFDVKNQFRGFWISSSVSGIFLSNISLHDLSNLGVYSGSGIHISNITIRDVSCYRNVYGGIVLPSTENLIIDNITAVLNNGGGISLTGADNFTLIDISSYGNSISTKNRPGLLLMDSTFGTIQGLTASGNSGGGLNLNNSSKIFISSSILKDQSGGVDFFIDSQSHDIALNNLRIGDLNGANLSASNISGSFSFNTSATHPDATGSFVSLNNYVNITHGSSGIFDLLSLNYSPSDIPFGYPENNIRILATNGTVWYPVSSTLHTDQHSVSFDDSDELWEGTWLYGLFTNKTIPSVLSVSPSSGSRESTNIEISITGSGFSEGSLVNLSNSTYNLTNSSDVTFTNTSYLTTTFDLTRLVSDNYSVSVKTPDQTESTESVLFSVYDPSCPAVVTSFSSNVSSGYAPLTVKFTNCSTGGSIDRLLWDFGDNTTSSESPEVVHTFSSAGTYPVNLTAWNSCDNFSSALHEIVVSSEPCPAVVASFSSNVSSGYAPLTVKFTNCSTGGSIDRLLWDFGDNTTSSESPEVVHTFNSAGTYPVNLTAWNSCDNFSSALHEIVVSSEPCPAVVANFSSNVSSGIAPLTVLFTNSSTGGTIDDWLWDFDDYNTLSDSPEAVHTFTNPGIYAVNLTVWNSCDNFSSVLHDIVVSSEPCPAVVANFSSNLSSGYAPLTVHFTNSSTGGIINRWAWQFGDGSNNESIGDPVHTFSSVGTYQVNLTTWNSCNNNSTVNHGIIVLSVPASAPTVTNITPSTGVNISSVNITALVGTNFVSGATVNLTRDGFANISGIDISVISPVRITCSLPIEGAGTGNWTIEVKNPDGQIGRLLNGFTVASAPCPEMITSFISNISSGTVPMTVLFDDISSGGVISSRTWNFGDSSPNETNQTVIHTFTSSGSYLVSLVTKNTCGNDGFATRQITVSPTPEPVTYIVNASADTGGMITPSGSMTVSSGASLAFNISSDSGYYISDVLVDGVSAGAVSNYVFSNISHNHWIHASFGIYAGNYTINATAGTGGTIHPSGVVVVHSSDDQKFTLSPDIGNSVSDVIVDNVSLGAVTSYTFTNVTENHVMSALFSRIPGEYAINSSSNQYGKIIPSGNNLYPENSNQSFKMQAKPGSMLSKVTVDSTVKSPVTNWTFTNLTEDHSIYSEGTPIPGQVLVFFSASPRWGSVPLDVKFNSQCLGDPISFFWQFGDGKTSSDQDPTHRYNSSGVYSVSLRASNEKNGGVGAWNKYITVNNGVVPEPTATPVPDRITPKFQYSPLHGTAPLSVNFTDMSSGNPVSWFWDFGDGSSSEDQNPVHKYKSAGLYSVMLQAQNSEYSGTVTVSDAITVR